MLTEYLNERERKTKGFKMTVPSQCYTHHLSDRETGTPFSSATRNSPLLVLHRIIVYSAKSVQSKIEHRPLMGEYNLAIYVKI